MQAKTTRARRAVLQLDVVCRNDMRKHGFQQVCSEETSRAIGRSDEVKLCVEDEEMKTTYHACPKGRYSVAVEAS